MLSWEPLEILSFGAGTPSTSLALMSAENAIRGGPVWPMVPVYDAVIFCDLHGEPGWVYEQAAFVAQACRRAGIPYYTLDTDLYGDFTHNFGNARVSSIPFWTLADSGKKGRMPRQCTYDYKIKAIERFVRYELLGYRPRERTIAADRQFHRMHMGIMWEEHHRARESTQTLFTNRFPLVEMGWTRPDCYAYNRNVWGLDTKASCCLFCPFHTNYFFAYIQEHEPECYACALKIDELVEANQAHPPLKSKLFLSKSRKRLRELTAKDCQDARTFLYHQEHVWNGF